MHGRGTAQNRRDYCGILLEVFPRPCWMLVLRREDLVNEKRQGSSDSRFVSCSRSLINEGLLVRRSMTKKKTKMVLHILRFFKPRTVHFVCRNSLLCCGLQEVVATPPISSPKLIPVAKLPCGDLAGRTGRHGQGVWSDGVAEGSYERYRAHVCGKRVLFSARKPPIIRGSFNSTAKLH